METKTAFAPLLTIKRGVTNIDFYKKAFGAVENWRLNNDDGTMHVAEFMIDGAIFHLHEMMPKSPAKVSPEIFNTSTVTIGLFTADVHGVFNQAIAAGATIISPVTDYEYGYRQGELKDLFGHHWVIQCHIPASPDWKG
ncbi:MAG: bleomycin resistance protein [Mucilaginibacter sp.]|uniref:VOC family protein n=1 Tax=Mucilaginibacter sp. TaxID=1882438 RepID=UPI00262F3CF5|nr:VOC family protein [Mucilaginibacter sp.]MDB5005371.1 bleomycin resistance protein [Mucilaginibacter sp.]